MGINVRGDTSELRKLIAALNRPEKALQLVARAMAEEAIELTREGFSKESDPDGKGWAPTQRGGRILQDTGRLRNSFRVMRVNARGFQIGTTVEYSGYHQSGTRRMPARKQLPDAGKIPRTWRSRLEEAAEDAFDALF